MTTSAVSFPPAGVSRRNPFWIWVASRWMGSPGSSPDSWAQSAKGWSFAAASSIFPPTPGSSRAARCRRWAGITIFNRFTPASTCRRAGACCLLPGSTASATPGSPAGPCSTCFYCSSSPPSPASCGAGAGGWWRCWLSAWCFTRTARRGKSGCTSSPPRRC